MKRITLLIFLVVACSSCFKTYEAISNVLTKDKDCWIDTRTMIFYYDGRELMTGISIWLHDDKKDIKFSSEPGQASITRVELIALKDLLTKQAVSITISRSDVHWRDDVSFYIEPKDWTKKRRIVSTHTHH
ncbi:MAG TPA: hypothetical protein VGO58_06605 [Chitinophagaceae bacterium]|jgi:hypothetical protein|nr:hypothetical protein [Chitinophagaceae bacterium]